ncbi:MAG TPA: Mrp/NBP35 family ATP-binding protein [Candidatus Lokiarchaeia archaeon]|nr:Mrp/NBP35 family ATP-binding protein [Candidatus Lokiarchaeia archaeon]
MSEENQEQPQEDVQQEKRSALEMGYQIGKRMECVKYKIAIISGKGGVGKTTVAVNLAYALAKQGKTVGLCDVDITGPMVPKMLHMEDARPVVDKDQEMIYPVDGPEGMKVLSMGFFLGSPDDAVIWRGPMKMSFVRQMLADFEWGDLDYLVFDLPPGTGDEILDILQLLPDVRVVIVSTPQDVSVIDARKTISMARTMKKEFLGLVENMSGFICPHCGEETPLFGKGGARVAAGEMGVPFLGSVPFEVSVRESGDTGSPIVADENSASGQAFQKIVAKVREEFGDTE